jgi:geranylgeranyl diphosphate synthase type I
VQEEARELIRKYGQQGYLTAKRTILDKKNLSKPLHEVLRYFIEETWPNKQHPALTSLACEAVGGKPNAPNRISAAIVLLTGAADIHDDIIDKSKTKNSKLTAFGKFRPDLVLLAGDALLFRGMVLLKEACGEFPEEKNRMLHRFVEEAFFEIGNAAAKERTFKGNCDLQPKKYLEIIEAKGAVSEACARIGATVGNGKREEVEVLGSFGRELGTLMTVRNEFTDLFDLAELRNRAKNEVLPLPLLYAFQNKQVKTEILELLRKGLTQQSLLRITDLTTKTEQVQRLREEMKFRGKKEENALNAFSGNTEALKVLLRLSMMGF